MLLIMRLICLSGTLSGLVAFGHFRTGFSANLEVPLALWAAGPLPLAYAAARPAARTPAAMRIVLGGLMLALLVGVGWFVQAWRAQATGQESLSGLVVIFAPFVQLLVVAPFIAVAWLVGRRNA